MLPEEALLPPDKLLRRDEELSGKLALPEGALEAAGAPSEEALLPPASPLIDDTSS